MDLGRWMKETNTTVDELLLWAVIYVIVSGGLALTLRPHGAKKWFYLLSGAFAVGTFIHNLDHLREGPPNAFLILVSVLLVWDLRRKKWGSQ